MYWLYFCAILPMLASLGEAKNDSVLVTTYEEPEGYKYRVYSDGKDVVTALFDDNGRLVDCDLSQKNSSLVAAVFHDAIVKQTSDQKIEMTDVRRVTRACKRFVRKVLRWTTGEADPGNFKEAKLRQELHKGVPGTSWCNLYGHQPDKTPDVEDPSTDKCCKQLHACNLTIPGRTLMYQHFNIYPWPVAHCNCTEAFYTCLSGSKGRLSREVGQLYFNVLRLRCFQDEDREMCTEWDEWYNVCKVFTKTKHVSMKENAQF